MRKYLHLGFFWQAGGVLLLTLTYIQVIQHRAVAPWPKDLGLDQVDPSSRFWPRQQTGINHIVLVGDDYQRGLAMAQMTEEILKTQERRMMSEFEKFFPQPLVRHTFVLLAMRWFWGIDSYFAPHHMRQMLGVSQAADRQYDSLLDPYTRQVAYHGIHELGQMFVDLKQADFGCTLFAVENADHWLIGRNFDFSIDRLFDLDKLIQWHFPSNAYAYLSVIWPGMVGAVTGVNQFGIYASLNAAGSEDFVRYGTPTSLVLADVLRGAASLEEAIDIVTSAQTLISEIFFISDGRRSVKIEKTPKQQEIIWLSGSSVIANHFESQRFATDQQNLYRIHESTTLQRFQRGASLVEQLRQRAQPATEAHLLAMLRDKKDAQDRPLPLGNRMAIDALIASHSIIYNPKRGVLYVSQGPALTGPFLGYDVFQSFAQRQPIKVDQLPEDAETPASQLFAVNDTRKALDLAAELILKGQCEPANQEINLATTGYLHVSEFFRVRGDWYSHCQADQISARKDWQKALELRPAYAEDRRYLRERLW